MKFRRGFKTEANWYAREMRSDLGVPLHGPLCPWKLAAHLGYVVVKLSDYAAAEPKAFAYLSSGHGQSEFSAVTLPGGGPPWIVHNATHSSGRQAALHIAEQRISHAIACEMYGVSLELLQMRLRVTGALIRVARRRAA